MNKWIIFALAVALVAVLWFSGFIPEQVAIISGTLYVKTHFPEMQLEYEKIEWSSAFGDYLITFKDNKGKNHTCCIGPKYFPCSLGQGIFPLRETYNDLYGE